MTELYICAVIADTELADQVWYQWANNEIDDDLAMLASWMITTESS